MKDRILTTLIALSLPSFAAAQQAAPAALTVPTGTTAPLTLITPIEKKVSVPGDVVHASVAFPITVGSQIAIPVGTIAEGQIVTVTKKAKDTQQPSVQIHFTQLIYSNGYTATLNATDATGFFPSSVVAPLTASQAADQASAPPPPAQPKGFFKKIFTFSSRTPPPKILIAAGWQFQLTLQTPLSLDASRVDAAAAKPLEAPAL